MDRVFLDANVLFSAAYKRNAKVQQLWKLVNVELITSTYAWQEARRNLRTRGQRIRLAGLMRRVAIACAKETEHVATGILLPEKDVPIWLAALAAEATHLVTGDVKHFGAYFGKTVAGVKILPPAAYAAEHTAHRSEES